MRFCSCLLLHCLLYLGITNGTTATVSKLIKEMIPEDVKCSNDTRDLILECCVGTLLCYVYLFGHCYAPIQLSRDSTCEMSY